MGAVASKIASLTIVYSIVYSDADQRKYQTGEFPAQMASNTEMFQFYDVIVGNRWIHLTNDRQMRSLDISLLLALGKLFNIHSVWRHPNVLKIGYVY